MGDIADEVDSCPECKAKAGHCAYHRDLLNGRGLATFLRGLGSDN